MKRSRKPKKNYVPEITPDLINTLLPVTRDAIVAFFDKSASQNPEQLKAAVVAAIAAFLSTLSNNGVYDQAYRAGIAASKSVPQAVIAANIANDKIRNPVRKINDTLRTTTSLIGKAAKSTLPGFSRAARESVANDVSAATAAFSLLPQNKETTGKGLIGGSSFNSDGLNTAWLVPDDDTAYIKGGSLSSFFGNVIDHIAGFVAPTGSYSHIVAAQDQYDRDYGFSPESAAPLQSTDADYAAIDPNRVSTWKDDPTAQSSWRDNPQWKNMLGVDTTKLWHNLRDKILTPEDTAQSTDADKPFFMKLGEKWDSFKDAVTGGNPLVTAAAIQSLPYVFQYGLPLAKSLFQLIGDNTYGRLRRLVKKTNFNETEPEEQTSWIGRAARKTMRGIQNVMKFNDGVLDGLSTWSNRKDVRRAASKLGKTILALAPAAAQDYINYKQRMKVFEQQKKAAKQQFMIDQQREKDAVDAYNANVIAQNKKEIRDAQTVNSNIAAKYAQELENHENLLKYDAKVKETTDATNLAIAEYRHKTKMAELSAEEAAAFSQKIFGGISAGLGAVGTILTVSGVATVPGLILDGLAAAAGYAAAAGDHSNKAKLLEQQGNAAGAQAELLAAQKNLEEATKTAEKYQKQFDTFQQKQLDKSQASIDKLSKSMQDAMAKFGAADARYEAAKARMKEYEGLVEPIQEYIAPYRQAPIEGSYVAVPDEIRPDDPRLRKFYAQQFIEPIAPPEMYIPVNTLSTIHNVLPELLADKPKKEKTVLPYVNPMPLEHVNAAQGRASTLRTTVTPTYRAPKQYNLQPSARNSATTSMYYRPQQKRRRL